MGHRKTRHEPMLLLHSQHQMVARRVALLAVDLTITLETFPIDHIAAESKLLSLQGYINRLLKMYWTKVRFEARKKLLEIERLEQEAKG